MPGGHQVRWEDSSLAVGAASILLPSAAEGSCPVELGNPPILALTLLRHKGCTVLRIGFFLLHQCGALKSHPGMIRFSCKCQPWFPHGFKVILCIASCLPFLPLTWDLTECSFKRKSILQLSSPCAMLAGGYTGCLNLVDPKFGQRVKHFPMLPVAQRRGAHLLALFPAGPQKSAFLGRFFAEGLDQEVPWGACLGLLRDRFGNPHWFRYWFDAKQLV